MAVGEEVVAAQGGGEEGATAQTHAVGSYAPDDRIHGLQSRVLPDLRVHVDGPASVRRGRIRTSLVRCES